MKILDLNKFIDVHQVTRTPICCRRSGKDKTKITKNYKVQRV